MRPYPTPPRPSARCRPASARRRLLPTRTSALGGWARPPPDLKARLGRKRGAFRTPRSPPVLSTRRRREHCKNPNTAGQAVWVDARHWGSVEMTARDSFEGGAVVLRDRGPGVRRRE